MQWQAISLSLIILFSLLISGTGLSRSNSSKTNLEVKKLSAEEEFKTNSSSKPFFIQSLYSVLSKKMIENVQDLSTEINVAGQTVSVINSNTTQNFSAIKQIFLNNTDNFLSGLNSKNISLNTYNNDNLALISEAKNNFEVPACDIDQSIFSSKAILMKYLDYNLNIFELNPQKRWPIASLSKLMTTLIAIEKIGLEKEIVISEKAVLTEGEIGDFKTGEVFKIGDLIKTILVVSSNDAAMAIAETLGEENFINEMQRKANELKMFQTTFLEPTGLSFINQSTITDLAKLINYIYDNHPEILEISRQKEIKILELKSNKLRKLSNIDKFAGQIDFIGGKTGYIEEAGHNLIALFNINNKTILTITLGADNYFEETEKLKKIIQECQ